MKGKVNAMKIAFTSFPLPLGTVTAGFVSIPPVALFALGAGLVVGAAVYVAVEYDRRQTAADSEESDADTGYPAAA